MHYGRILRRVITVKVMPEIIIESFTMEKKVKFLQIADVHLDSGVSSSLNMPSGKEQIRQKEHKEILINICGIVEQEEIDAVLIPGDLIDYEASSFDTTQFLVECFSKLAPVPVVIVPGNHDYYSSSSVYNPEFLRERRQTVWSENVIIFRKPEFESIELPNVKGVWVTAAAHIVNRPVTERLLKGYVPKNDENVNILMFHGSRDTYKPPEKKITLPFSDDEVLQLGFDYTAVGHYHSYSEIIDDGGNVKGAYSGCPFGRNLRECGEKYIIIGTIYEDAAVEIEKRKIDKRSIYDISVDCTGLSHTEAILNAVGNEIKKITRDKNDIVYARLTGLIFPEIRLKIPENFLEDEYFHITFDSADLKPDYALEDYLSVTGSADTIQSRFVKELKKQMDNTADENEKEIIESAMYYGLDALILKSVKPRHKT